MIELFLIQISIFFTHLMESIDRADLSATNNNYIYEDDPDNRDERHVSIINFESFAPIDPHNFCQTIIGNGSER